MMDTENDRNGQGRKAPLGFYRHWIPSTKNRLLVKAMMKHGTVPAFAAYCILIEELYISGEDDPQGGGRLGDTDIGAIAFKWRVDDEGMAILKALLDDSGLFVKDGAGAYCSEEVDAGLADIAANRRYEREKKSKAKKGRQLPEIPGGVPGEYRGIPGQ